MKYLGAIFKKHNGPQESIIILSWGENKEFLDPTISLPNNTEFQVNSQQLHFYIAFKLSMLLKSYILNNLFERCKLFFPKMLKYA